MPFNLNLKEKVDRLMIVKVKPYGWVDSKKDGVELEFGICYINNYDPEPSMCMRVKGTNHVWAWFNSNFKVISKGNYVDIFTKQLEEFRIDFLLWIHTPETSQLKWVREYYEIFKGMFYDFSPEEQKEFEKSKEFWDKTQESINKFASEFNNEGMSNQ